MMDVSMIEQSPGKPLRLLLIEDEPAFRRLVREMIREVSDHPFEFFESSTLAGAHDWLEKGLVDLVLLDLGLPDSQGLETLKQILLPGINLPVLVFTGSDDTALGIAAVRQGASDYLVKGRVDGRTLERSLWFAFERHRQQRVIAEALREKEVLLKEVHHRVKNNMQVILSLIMLQHDETDDPVVSNMLKECFNRIKAMSMVHEKLHQSQTLSSVKIDDYTRDLVQDLMASYGAGAEAVAVALHIDELELPLNWAINYGLIVNELVSNVFRHAFSTREAENNTLTVAFRNGGDKSLQLSVTDNGGGLPEDVRLENVATLGLRLVMLIARDQLGGRVDVERLHPGTRFQITLPGIEEKDHG